MSGCYTTKSSSIIDQARRGKSKEVSNNQSSVKYKVRKRETLCRVIRTGKVRNRVSALKMKGATGERYAHVAPASAPALHADLCKGCSDLPDAIKSGRGKGESLATAAAWPGWRCCSEEGWGMRHAVRRLIEAFAWQKWAWPAGATKAGLVRRQPASRLVSGARLCRKLGMAGRGGKRGQTRNAGALGSSGDKKRAGIPPGTGGAGQLAVEKSVRCVGYSSAAMHWWIHARGPRGVSRHAAFKGHATRQRGRRGDADTAAAGTGRIPELVLFWGEGGRPFLLDQSGKVGTPFVHSLAKDGGARKETGVQEGQATTQLGGQHAPADPCCCRACQMVQQQMGRIRRQREGARCARKGAQRRC
jgi:hypothetical protein